VLTAITEQKQVFEGAAHPFYWKPKLRIPDIYENKANKQAFGRFREACLGATREDPVLAEISRLAAAQIKGLGPAAANIIYFLHPTIIPPFNTADVIWLRRGGPEIVSAFEIEKSTSIYSGILRMEDLGRSIPGCTCHFYLVAPDQREKEVLAQLTRPSFRTALAELSFAYIPFSELQGQCDALCRFGGDHSAMLKIARHAVLSHDHRLE
jgi:hypothetical protein